MPARAASSSRVRRVGRPPGDVPDDADVGGQAPCRRAPSGACSTISSTAFMLRSARCSRPSRARALAASRAVGLALELGEHALGDQLVAALGRLRVRPLVGQAHVAAEAAGLLLQALDLLARHVGRADRAEPGVVDEVDHLAHGVGAARRPSAGTRRCAGSSRTTGGCRTRRPWPPAPWSRRCASCPTRRHLARSATVPNVAARSSITSQCRPRASNPAAWVAPIDSRPTPYLPASRGPDGDATAGTATSNSGFEYGRRCRRASTRFHVLVWLVTGSSVREQLHDDVEALLEERPGLGRVEAEHDGVGRQRARARRRA